MARRGKRSATALARRERKYHCKVAKVTVREYVEKRKDGQRKKNGKETIVITYTRRNGRVGRVIFERKKNGHYVRETVHREPIMIRQEGRFLLHRVYGNTHPAGKGAKWVTNCFSGEYKESTQQFRYWAKSDVLRLAEHLSRGRGYTTLSD